MKISNEGKSILYSFSILIISVVAIATLGLLPGIGVAIGASQAKNGDIS